MNTRIYKTVVTSLFLFIGMMVCNSAIAQDTKYTIFAKVTLIQKGADYTGNQYRLTITSYLPGEDEAPSYLSEAITKDNVNAYFEYVGSSQYFKMPWEVKDNGISSYYSEGNVLPPYITEVYIEASTWKAWDDKE